MTQRRPPIRSKAYRDGSRGQPCTLRIAGVCTGGGEDTVFAHIRDSHFGKGVKASDLSGCDACAACHAVFDGRESGQLDVEDWLVYALRGLQETMERRLHQGLLSMPADAKEASTAAPKRPIPQRKTDWPSRKMVSRGFERKEK